MFSRAGLIAAPLILLVVPLATECSTSVDAEIWDCTNAKLLQVALFPGC